MTIRYTCPDCTAVLKIKDELGGAHAHCPKCKAAFVVPMPVADHHESTGSTPNPLLARSDPDALGLSSLSLPVTAIPGSDQSEHDSNSAETALNPPQSIPLVAANSVSPADRDSQVPAVLPTSEADEPEEASVLTARLQIGDSVSEIQDPPDAKDAMEDRPVVVGSSKNESTDDDDLDSPPVFVSSMPSALKPKPSVTDPAKSSFRLPVADVPPPSRKPSLPIPNDDAFDPMKFMPPDSPIKANRSFPAKSPSDMDLSLSNDTVDDLADRPTPQPSLKKAPSSSSNRAPVEKIDLATAAKMMKKAIKDNQAETAHQREMKAEAGYDYFLFLREFGARGFALLGGSVVMVCVLYFVGQYTFGSQLKLPKLGYVRGTVKLDGQALAGAIVSYEPLDKKMDGHNRARTSTGVTDDKGFFKMMYVDKTEGVAAGKCYVSVAHVGSKGNDVPVDWMVGAMVTRDVTPGHQKDPTDINMVSKK